MCGVSGFVGAPGESAALADMARAMIATLRHRGPDDQGVWSDGEAGVGLSQARLSIIDLSPAGHQPMVSASGRYVIVYNGEVYDTAPLRAELEAKGVAFRGHSDTEIILEACAAFGVAAATRRLVGMFAFALWDRRERTLHLVRDRLGIKPLYYGLFGTTLVFGSELKALRAHPAVEAELDRAAMAAFVRFNYVPAPRSIYRNIFKLPPGHILSLRPGAAPDIACYWDLRAIARQGVRAPVAWSDAEAEEQLHRMLSEAVRLRMVADVPLGAFLSGGIDSSTVVALMQAQSPRPIKTFSIGMAAEGYNEAEHAKAVAGHLGTEHTELYVDPAHARDIIPNLPHWYDEPFADSSQIPTFLVSELTRRHVTVALSGDGGDEVFGGYSRYLWGEMLWNRAAAIPAPLRRVAGGALARLSPSAWHRLAALLPARLRPSHLALKAQKVAAALAAPDSGAFFRRLVTGWDEPLVRGAEAGGGVLWDRSVEADIPAFMERMQYLDTVTYLPDDILCKVDRASMAVALEARVPLLDHRLVELSWRLPRRLKVRDGQGKWLLRQVLYRHVPRALVERPKMGFGIPVGDWLRGPLRDWAEDLLSVEALEKDDLFHAAPIRARFADHLAGRGQWDMPLWGILMAQAWRRHWNM
jgi:asparagine synthase (glutamine-hydrolysing)